MSKERVVLFAILGLALFLRIWGIDYGLPYFLIDDERALVYTSLKMAELKTLIPSFHPEEFRIAYYAPLMSYIYLFFLIPFILIKYLFGPFGDFRELADYFVLNPGSLWLIARVVNAFMGVAAVYFVYLIGKKICNVWVGLIASSLFAFSFYNIQFSHFARPWGPAVFFISLMMLLAVYIFQSSRQRHYLLIGFAGGLGFGAHYASVFGMIVFLIAHFFSGEFPFLHKIKDKKLWLTIAIFISLIFLFISLNYQLFLSWTGISRLAEFSTADKSFSGYLRMLTAYFKTLTFLEPVILLFSLPGIIFLFFKSRKFFFIALSWPVAYLLFLYLFFYPEFYAIIAHYIILITPWLAVLSGFAIYYFILKLPNLIKVTIIAALLLYPFLGALQYGYLLNQKDTRILAKEWIEENIPAKAKIFSNLNHANPIPTKEAILFQKEIDGSPLRAADLVLLGLNDDNYPEPAYNIFRTAYINEEKSVRNQDYQYFLMHFWQDENLSQEEAMLLRGAAVIQEFRQSKKVKAQDIHSWRLIWPIYKLFYMERFGPTVRIYKL